MLDCPILSFAGKNDLWTYPLQISSWSKLSLSSKNESLLLDGHHFLTKKDMLKIETNLKSIIEYADQNIKNIKSDILARSLSFETLY